MRSGYNSDRLLSCPLRISVIDFRVVASLSSSSGPNKNLG